MTPKSERGQSLVEMAIITPLLLFIALGMIEVGYVLRNDLIVMNTSREAARFASKADYLTVTDTEATGYETVVNHAIDSAAGQLHNELFEAGESGMVISQIVATVTMTDCATGNYHVLFPGEFGREDLSYSTAPQYKSRVDYLRKAQEVGERHRNIACRYTDDSGQPLGIPTEHLIIVEMFYTSHQLLGVPIISNQLSDPIPLYSKAVMRKTTGRDSY